jgi:modification methylase
MDLLLPGQILTFAKDRSISATILANGHIQCDTLVGSIHSVAKSLLHGVPVNGWEVWLFKENGCLQPIDVLRKNISRSPGNHAQTE